MYQIPLDNQLIVDNFAGGGGASCATRFVDWVRAAIDRGEIEVKFVVKNHRYPDPKNRYHWRKKQPDLFQDAAKPKPGDSE